MSSAPHQAMRAKPTSNRSLDWGQEACSSRVRTGTSSGAKRGIPQHKRQGNDRKRHQHEHPEGVDVSEECCLCLDLISDPGYHLALRFLRRAAAADEVAHDLLNGVLKGDVRRHHVLDEPAVVELLAMRHDVCSEGNSDRAAGIAS